MGPLMRFSECESMVFISYAHADDELNNEWVSNFAIELKKDLEAALSREKNLGRAQLPGVYLSKYTGPVSGNLGPQLREQVEKSFAMFIVVDENYASSDWCLRELQYFNERFGGEGLDARLAILALRKPPIDAVTAKPAWKTIFAARNPVWKDFVNPLDLNQGPIAVLRDDGRGLTSAFNERYEALRRDLLDKIRADLIVPPVVKPPSRWLIGACRPELQATAKQLADRLGEAEPLTGLVEDAALQSGKLLQARLQVAQVLILPFNSGQPLFDAIDGGHIALQVAAWRKLNKPDDGLLLLDLSDIAATEAAEPQHQQYLADCTLARLSPARLIAKLVPSVVGEKPGDKGRPTLPVRVFIESNRTEPGEWRKLGEQIQSRWDKLLLAHPVEARLSLRTSGFDIDALDDFSFNEADGLVMLWGQKDRRSLVSQITAIDDQLIDPAPAIVARLTPPQPASAQRLPACKWDVLRFCSRSEPLPMVIEPEPDDDEILNGFVHEVLSNGLRRHKLPAPAGL